MKQSFENREDKTLIEKLLAERPGILNLALRAESDQVEAYPAFLK